VRAAGRSASENYASLGHIPAVVKRSSRPDPHLKSVRRGASWPRPSMFARRREAAFRSPTPDFPQPDGRHGELAMGYGPLPVVVLCALIVFFPMVVNTMLGMRTLDLDLVDSARVEGAGGLSLLWYVELPLALPSILAGLRTSLTLSITGAVVGEFVVGGHGLGELLIVQRSYSGSSRRLLDPAGAGRPCRRPVRRDPRAGEPAVVRGVDALRAGRAATSARHALLSDLLAAGWAFEMGVI
jgi:binding-protein-dependent transport system inner membrane component